MSGKAWYVTDPLTTPRVEGSAAGVGAGDAVGAADAAGATAARVAGDAADTVTGG